VDGTEVSTHYDPMLAKVIAYGPDRASAARRLSAALAGSQIHGLTTNRDLLVNVLRHKDFLAGDTDTEFLARHGVAELAASRLDRRVAGLAAVLAESAARRAKAVVQPGIPAGWRNLPSQPQRVSLVCGDEAIEVDYQLTRDGLITATLSDVTLVKMTPSSVVLDVSGVRQQFSVAGYDTPTGRRIEVDSAGGSVAFLVAPRFADPAEQVVAGATVAPMPGTVVTLSVTAGDKVKVGDELLVLEAMKMRHTVVAATSGVVGELRIALGQQVDAGAVLAVIEEESS
jgi:propionyl-CoA carboxylase alpha chain